MHYIPNGPTARRHNPDDMEHCPQQPQSGTISTAVLTPPTRAVTFSTHTQLFAEHEAYSVG
jgi:hypothetical protein